MGQRLRDVYPHATRFQVIKWRVREGLKWLLRMFTMGTIGSTVAIAIFMAGQYSSPVHLTAQTVMEQFDSPVLSRIAKCESGNTHFDKNGQVLVRANTNKTVDVGRYQINSVWFSKATGLGLNLFVEKDNEAFARWLYANEGTQPWYSSAKCWQ